MTDFQRLKERFAGLKGVTFDKASNFGFSTDGTRGCVAIENAFGRIVLALNGAHLLSYVPAGKRDVLWVSPRAQMTDGAPIRGGMPLCCPWFGAGPDGEPLHGYARISDWAIDEIRAGEDGSTKIVLSLPAAGGSAGAPRHFAMRLSLELASSLKLVFWATNENDVVQPLEFAFHTYFNVGDVEEASVSGLDGCRFVDRRDAAEGVQEGPVQVAGPIDRLYLDPPTIQTLSTPLGAYRIAGDAKAAVIWNLWDEDAAVPDFGPGAHRRFLRLERLDAALRAVDLAPGATYRTEMTVARL